MSIESDNRAYSTSGIGQNWSETALKALFQSFSFVAAWGAKLGKMAILGIILSLILGLVSGIAIVMIGGSTGVDTETQMTWAAMAGGVSGFIAFFVVLAKLLMDEFFGKKKTASNLD